MKLTRFEEWIEATKALFFFRRYTAMPRLLEIGYSAVAWGCLFVILWAVTGCVKDGEKVDDLVTIEIDGCEYL